MWIYTPTKCILEVHSIHTHIHTHTHTHTHILIPFEDHEPMGLNVDIAISSSTFVDLILG